MLSATVILFASSCKSDDKPSSTPALSIEPHYATVLFSADGSALRANNEVISSTFTVLSEEASWDVSVGTSSWLSIANKTTNTFTLEAQPNESAASPAPATVTVTGIKAKPVTFTVTQAGKAENPDLYTIPSYSALVFSANGQTAYSNSQPISSKTIQVVSNEWEWNVSINQPWLTFVKEGNTFTLAAAVNTNDTPSAPATVTITGVDATPVTIAVTQEAFPTALQNAIAPFAVGSANSYDPRYFAVQEWTTNEMAAGNGNVMLRPMTGDNPASFFDHYLVLTAWSDRPVPSMVNGKLYQSVWLEAGTYTFSALLHFAFLNVNGSEVYMVAAQGADLPNIANLYGATLEYLSVVPTAQEVFGLNQTLSIDFTISQKRLVSLGFVANFADAEVYFTKVELTKK